MGADIVLDPEKVDVVAEVKRRTEGMALTWRSRPSACR
jgi:hypothetical protein